MTIIASDNLIFSIGDGAAPEQFLPIHGVRISRLDLQQRQLEDTTIQPTAWRPAPALAQQSLVLDCTALADDSAGALRLRTLALGALAGNFRLIISPTQQLSFSGLVPRYRETITAGALKQVECRVESAGITRLEAAYG